MEKPPTLPCDELIVPEGGSSGKSVSRLRRIVAFMGPGLVTGAADDDPSGIATYSIAGAQLGTSVLWLSWITWPLMGATQMMCARIGMATGQGLAAALRRKMPWPILALFTFALLIANVVNIGADLYGMADAANLLWHVNLHAMVIVFGVVITVLTIRFNYQRLAAIFKWLALILFTYVLTVFLLKPDWGPILHDTVFPSLPSGKGWSIVVAILGTTISPYLFYWQSSLEVEESKALGHVRLSERRECSEKMLTLRRWDVGVGTFFSNFVMYFIILAAALTLHAHGQTRIETSRQAAEALRPLAGNLAYVLYTVGVLGVGFLAIPTLCGSAAYAFAETFGWRQGLDRPWRGARHFYAVIIFAMVVGIALVFSNLNPIKALYFSAVVNGLLAPFLLVAILLAASDPVLMQGQPSSRLSRVVVGITIVAMFGCAIGMFIF